MAGNSNSGRRLRYPYPQTVGERVRSRIASMDEYHRARNAIYMRARVLGQVLRVKRLCNEMVISRDA